MTSSQQRERVEKSVNFVLMGEKKKKRLPLEIRKPLKRILARWVINKGLYNIEGARTLHRAAKDEIFWQAKRWEWMSDPKHHLGAKAGKLAAKAINDLVTERITTASQTRACCAAFCDARTQHIRTSRSAPGLKTNVATRPLGDGFRLHKMTEADVARVGASMRNCLANAGYRGAYKLAIRNGEIDLFTIYDHDEKPVVLFSVDPDTQCLLELNGFRNKKPTKYLTYILNALRHLSVSVGTSFDASALGITDCDLE